MAEMYISGDHIKPNSLLILLLKPSLCSLVHICDAPVIFAWAQYK